MALINCEECGREISDKAKSCPHCGYKKRNEIIAPAGLATPNKGLTNIISKLPIIIIVAVFLIIILYPNKNSSSFEDTNRSNDLRHGYTEAKKTVNKELKSPSTAKFADFSKIKFRDNKDGTYIIESYVDSQNSFGATVRTKFRCTITDYGTCKDLIFY